MRQRASGPKAQAWPSPAAPPACPCLHARTPNASHTPVDATAGPPRNPARVHSIMVAAGLIRAMSRGRQMTGPRRLRSFFVNHEAPLIGRDTFFRISTNAGRPAPITVLVARAPLALNAGQNIPVAPPPDHASRRRSAASYPARDARACRRHFPPYPRSRQRPGRPRPSRRHHRRQPHRRRTRRAGAGGNRPAPEARRSPHGHSPRAARRATCWCGPDSSA